MLEMRKYPYSIICTMQKQFLALYDNRPFFERALQYGVKSGIIGQSRLNEILEDGPVGIIQIAETFGEKTANLRPNILAARNRIVNLVSLYLENISE